MAGVDRLLAILQRNGVRRGVQGASRAWLWIAIASWGMRKIRSGNQPQVVYRGKLKPGETIEVSHLTETVGPPSRRRRRKR